MVLISITLHIAPIYGLPFVYPEMSLLVSCTGNITPQVCFTA